MILPDLRPEDKKREPFTRGGAQTTSPQPFVAHDQLDSSSRGTASTPCRESHTQQMTYHAMRLLSTRFGMADGWSPSIRTAALPWGRKFRVSEALMHFGRACCKQQAENTHPTSSAKSSASRNRLGRENSRHSNRHAPRNTMERKVRSKIR